MSRFLWTVGLLALITRTACAAEEPPIDRTTLDRWSAPYRGWHYWPDPIIPAEPKIPGHETFRNTDVPCVYQLPGQSDKWYMSFIAFNGHGYNSFVAESDEVLTDLNGEKQRELERHLADHSLSPTTEKRQQVCWRIQ